MSKFPQEEQAMELTNSLPLSSSDFAYLIDNKMLYVDKTDLAGDLARWTHGSFLLIRPPHFGKTLLVSTLKELFLNGKGRFEGLKLEKDEPWTDTGTYKVIKLSFSSSAKPDPGQTFYQTFGSKLKEQCLKAGLAWTDKTYWTDSFDDALYKADNCSVVLLIDEYDAPLTHVLDKPDEYEDRRDYLASFFSILKDFDEKFRFVFITGVTRITQLGLFSGPNNIDDISFASEYGAITGFTQEELEQNFKPYIANAAKILKREKPQEQWDEQKVLSELKAHYDGYSFDRFAESKVYNPWTLINFFANPEKEFEHYWLDSSNSLLLNKFLQRLTVHPDDLLAILDCLNYESRGYSYNTIFPLLPHIKAKNFPIIALMYQAGFLTVKKECYKVPYLGIPNEEVKPVFHNAAIATLTKNKIKDLEGLKAEYLQNFTEAFAAKNMPAMKELLNKIIKQCPYESFEDFNPHKFTKMLGGFIYLITGYSFEVIHALVFPEDRADLHIRAGSYSYVFEIKVTNDRKKADEIFEEGKKDFLLRRAGDLTEPLPTFVPCVMIIVNEPQKDEQRTSSPLQEIVYLEELPLTQKQLSMMIPQNH